MSYSQPLGYRMPGRFPLPALARKLEHLGWPLWRVEVVRALSAVTVELLRSAEDRDAVFRSISQDQLSEADLLVSNTFERGLLHRAAEFLDLAHGILHTPSAIPLPPKYDLRCTAQFMDDPDDAEDTWTYVLLGTEHRKLEERFADMDGIENYPVEMEEDPLEPEVTDPEREERLETWNRVLRPYSRSSPLEVSAPEPQIMFDIIESIESRSDGALAFAEKITVTATVNDVNRRLGGKEDLAALRERVLAPIRN
ncbi:MAG: hypothetical protein WA880_01595 [Ornithinimicrobium sp.]